LRCSLVYETGIKVPSRKEQKNCRGEKILAESLHHLRLTLHGRCGSLTAEKHLSAVLYRAEKHCKNVPKLP
jgi:hypothetical protein